MKNFTYIILCHKNYVLWENRSKQDDIYMELWYGEDIIHFFPCSHLDEFVNVMNQISLK